MVGGANGGFGALGIRYHTATCVADLSGENSNDLISNYIQSRLEAILCPKK